ncbi:putative membrane attachment protein, partial [Toxoplasma gondii GAB2-2007-GAL-DOM2]
LFVAVRLSADLVSVLCPAPPGNSVVDPPSFSTGFLSPSVLCVAAGDADDAHNAESEDPPAPAEADPLGSSSLSQRFYHAMTTPLPDVLVGPETAEQRLEKEVRLIHGLRAHEVEVDNVQKQKKQAVNPVELIGSLKTYSKDVSQLGKRQESGVHVKRANILIQQVRATSKVLGRMARSVRKGEQAIAALLKDAKALAGSKSVPERVVTAKLDLLQRLKTSVDTNTQLADGQVKAKLHFSSLLGELFDELKWLGLNGVQTHEARRLQQEGRAMRKQVAVKLEKLKKGHAALRKAARRATSVVETALFSILKSSLARGKRIKVMARRVKEQTERLDIILAEANDAGRQCRKLQKKAAKSRSESVSLHIADRSQTLLETVVRYVMISKQSLAVGLSALNDISSSSRTLLGVVELEPVASSDVHRVQATVADIRSRAQTGFELHDMLTEGLNRDTRAVFRALRIAYGQCDAASKSFWTSLRKALELRSLPPAQAQQLSHMLSRKNAVAANLAALVVDVQGVMQTALKASSRRRASGMSGAVIELNTATELLKALDAAMTGAYAAQVGVVALPSFVQNMTASLHLLRTRFWSAPHRRLKAVIKAGIQGTARGARLATELEGSFKRLNRQRLQSMQRRKQALYQIQKSVIEAFTAFHRHEKFVGEYNRRSAELEVAEAMMSVAIAALDKRSLENVNRNMNGKGKTKAKKGRRKNVKGTVLDKAKARAFSRAKTKLENNLEAKRAKVKANELARLNMSGKVMKKMKEKRREKERAQAAARRIKEQQRTTTSFEHSYVAVAVALRSFAVLRKALDLPPFPGLKKKERLLHAQLEEVQKVLRTSIKPWTPEVVVRTLKNVEANLGRIVRVQDTVMRVLGRHGTLMKAHTKTLSNVLRAFYLATGLMFKTDLRNAKQLLAAAVAGRQDIISAVDKYKTTCGMLQRVTDPQAPPMSFRDAEGLLVAIHKLDSLVDRLWNVFLSTFVSLKETLKTMERREALMPREVKKKSRRSRVDIEAVTKSLWESAFEAHKVLQRVQSLVAKWRVSAAEKLREGIARKLQEVDENQRKITAEAARLTEETVRHKAIVTAGQKLDFSRLNAQRRASWRQDFGKLREAEAALPAQMHWQEGAAKYVAEVAEWIHARHWSIYRDGSDVDHKLAVRVNKAASNALKELRIAQEALDQLLLRKKEETAVTQLGVLAAHQEALATQLKTRAAAMTQVAQNAKETLRLALKKPEAFQADAKTREKHLVALQSRIKAVLEKYDGAGDPSVNPEDLLKEMDRTNSEVTDLLERHPHLAKHAWTVAKALKHGRGSVSKIRDASKSMGGELEILRSLADTLETDLRVLELNRMLVAAEKRARNTVARLTRLKELEMEALSDAQHAEVAASRTDDWETANTVLARARDLLHKAEKERATWQAALRERQQELSVINEKWDVPDAAKCDAQMRPVVRTVKALRDTVVKLTAEAKELVDAEDTTYTALQQAVTNLEKTTLRRRLVVARHRVEEIARADAVTWKEIADLPTAVDSVRRRLRVFQETLGETTWRNGLSDEAVIKRAAEMDARFDRVAREVKALQTILKRDTGAEEEAEAQEIVAAFAASGQKDATVQADVAKLQQRVSEDQQALAAARKGMKKVNALFAEVSRLDEQRRARDQVYTFRVRQENLVKEITMLVGKQKALKNRLKEQAERGLKLEDVPQSRVDTSALGVKDDPNGDLSKIDSWLQEAQTLLEEGNTQMLSSSEQIQVVDETRRDLRDDMKSAYLKQHPDDVGRFAREGDEQNRRLEQLLHEARNANDAISVALAVLEDQKIKVAAKVAPLRAVVAETEIARMAEAETQLASVIRDLLGRHIRLGEQMLEFRHFLEEQEAFLLQGSAAFTRSRSGKEADEISRRGARIIEAATQLRAAWEAHADDRLALARFQRELATGLLPTEQLKEYATNPNVAEAVRDLVTRRKQNVQLVVQGSKAIQTMGREFADTAKRAGELSKLAQSVRRFFGLSSGQATVRAQLETLAEAAKKTQQGASGLIQQLSTLLSRAEQTTKSGDALDMGPGTRELMDTARMALERNPVEQWHQDLEAIGGQLRQLDDYIASLPHALLDSDIFAEELNNIRLAQGALYKSLERSRAMVDAADRRRFDLHVATTAATDFFHGATLTSAREHVEKLGAEETARHREIELVRSQIEALIRDLKTVLTSASAEGSAAAVDRNASARVQQLLSRRSALEGFAGIISRVTQLVNQREEVVRQLLKRAGTTGPVELAAVPVGEAVAQSKEMLKACESLVSEARALFAAVERLGGDLAILAEVSNARQRQHRLQGEAHRVKALLEQTLVSAQSQIVKVRGAYRSVASDDANGNPNFQQANSVLSVVKLAGRDAATSVVHITQESANLDREIADIEAKTQAATGPVRAQIRQLQAIQGELRVAISQLRGRIALLARAAQELEDAAGDLTGHLKRQALAVAQDQIAAKMKEQEDLAEEVERDEAAVDQLRRDVDRLLAMRQRHADGMDADAGFQPRRLSSQGDHVAKAEELAAHLSETAARVQNAQRELAKSEASWRRFEGLRDPVNALRSLTNKSSRTLDRLGRKLGQILSDLAGLEKVGEASDVGVLISDAHAALDRLSGQADGVVREAREVRGAAQSATEACRQENSAVAILRSSFADNAVYGRRAAVYQEAVATLQIGDAKSRQWSHIVKETEGSWTVLGETVTLLRRVEKNPVVFEGLRKVAERLELLTPMVRQMAGVVDDARAALRKLYEEANALRPHVFAPRPQPGNSLADLELRANSLRSEAEGLLVKAEMAERQSKALGRGRVSRPRRWRHGEPYPTRVDVDGLPDLEAAAQSVRVWREHLQRLREANSQAAREAAKSGRQSARLLATTAETDAALQRLEAMLNDLERDLQRDLLEHQVHSEIHRDRGHDMQRDRDRDIERDTRRDRERDPERDAHRDRERDPERDAHRDRERDMERSTRSDRERDMERSTRRDRERDMER